MYALPLKIDLPPSKPVTVDIRQELGRGVCGVVIEALIDERQCALKLVLLSPSAPLPPLRFVKFFSLNPSISNSIRNLENPNIYIV